MDISHNPSTNESKDDQEEARSMQKPLTLTVYLSELLFTRYQPRFCYSYRIFMSQTENIFIQSSRALKGEHAIKLSRKKKAIRALTRPGKGPHVQPLLAREFLLSPLLLGQLSYFGHNLLVLALILPYFSYTLLFHPSTRM